jgi:hypothetical protein
MTLAHPNLSELCHLPRTAATRRRTDRIALLVGLWFCAGHAAAQADAAADTEAGAATTENTPQSNEPATPLRISLQVGAGTQERLLTVPSATGTRALDTGFGPALSLRASARLREAGHFIGARITYQTSIGLTVHDSVPDATTPSPGRSDARSHRFETGILAGLRLSAAADAPSLALFLGYALRAFASDARLQIPAFTLHGPLVRVEFELPLLSGLLALQIAPELTQIVSVSEALRDQAELAHGGQSIGVEANLRLRLRDRFGGRISYREAHARISAGGIDHFYDVERYLLLEVLYRYY